MKNRLLPLFATLVAAVVLGCTSCQMTSLRETTATPQRKVAGTYDSVVDNDASANFTCEEIFDTLRSSKPPLSSIELTLKALQSQRPGFFKRYTLLPNSESLHGSSPEFPRALVYGGNAKTIVSFNGSPDQIGYERLELMCFRDKEKRFEFFDIAFPKEAGNPSALFDLSPEEKKQAFVISPVNGRADRSCTQCHQIPARPNWDTYPVWPSSMIPVHEGQTPETNAAEEQLWKAFEPSSKSGRYATLDTSNKYNASPDSLGRILTHYNYLRIIEELKKMGAHFERVKLAFAKALFCQSPQISFANGQDLPVLPISSNFKSLILSSLSYHERKAMRLKTYLHLSSVPNLQFFTLDPEYFKNENLPKGYEKFLGSVDFHLLSEISELQKVVAPLGVDIKNWSMVFEGGYDFQEGQTERFGPLEKEFISRFYGQDEFLVDRVEDSMRSPDDHHQRKIEVCQHLSKLK